MVADDLISADGAMLVRDRCAQVSVGWGVGACVYPSVPAGGPPFLVWLAREVRSVAPNKVVLSSFPGSFFDDTEECGILAIDLDDYAAMKISRASPLRQS